MASNHFGVEELVIRSRKVDVQFLSHLLHMRTPLALTVIPRRTHLAAQLIKPGSLLRVERPMERQLLKTLLMANVVERIARPSRC